MLTTTTTVPIRETIARLLSPEAADIASNLAALSGKNVQVADVTTVARSVCSSAFKAMPAISYFRTTLGIRNPLSTLPVSDRLLAFASTTAVCTRPPSVAEKQKYQLDFLGYALDTNSTSVSVRTTPATPAPLVIPDAFATRACDLLAQGKGLVDKGLNLLLKFATDERIDGGVALTLAVEVASEKCLEWFPSAQQIYRSFIG